MTRSTAVMQNLIDWLPGQSVRVTSAGNFNMPLPKKDSADHRDVALVMLATFFFMISNMIITPIIAVMANPWCGRHDDGHHRRRDEFCLPVLQTGLRQSVRSGA